MFVDPDCDEVPLLHLLIDPLEGHLSDIISGNTNTSECYGYHRVFFCICDVGAGRSGRTWGQDREDDNDPIP